MEIVPFDPATLVKIALLNPVVIVVAFLMGRRADQWQKLIVAAFAASLAGYALYWLAAAVGLMPVHALGGEAAIVLMQFLAGLVWAGLGYWLARKRRS
jgi:ABC-type nickel/cobalt efflux system permease component RcnA